MKKRLTPDPKNPRRISGSQLRALDEALAAFGDLGGIVFNRKLDKLVAGHQRSKALHVSEVTYTEELESPDECGTVAWGYVMRDGQRFSYREVEWDEKKHRAAMLAANKHGGEWDEGLLVAHLETMDLTDLVLSGFTMDERDEMKPGPPANLSGKTKTIDQRKAAAVLALEKLREAAEDGREVALARKVATFVKSLGSSGD